MNSTRRWLPFWNDNPYSIPNFISGDRGSIFLTLEQGEKKWGWILITWDCCSWLQFMQQNTTLKVTWEENWKNKKACFYSSRRCTVFAAFHPLSLIWNLTPTWRGLAPCFSHGALIQSDNFLEHNYFTKFGARECGIDYSFFSQLHCLSQWSRD